MAKSRRQQARENKRKGIKAEECSPKENEKKMKGRRRRDDQCKIKAKK